MGKTKYETIKDYLADYNGLGLKGLAAVYGIIEYAYGSQEITYKEAKNLVYEYMRTQMTNEHFLEGSKETLYALFESWMFPDDV